MVPRVANDRTGFQSRYDGGIIYNIKVTKILREQQRERKNCDAQSIAGVRRKDKIRQGL